MATIYDVARVAGVSPKTVSRVMNGDAPVNARTRETVEAAMGRARLRALERRRAPCARTAPGSSDW